MEEPHSDTGGVAVVFGIDHRKASAQVPAHASQGPYRLFKPQPAAPVESSALRPPSGEQPDSPPARRSAARIPAPRPALRRQLALLPPRRSAAMPALSTRRRIRSARATLGCFVPSPSAGAWIQVRAAARTGRGGRGGGGNMTCCLRSNSPSSVRGTPAGIGMRTHAGAAGGARWPIAPDRRAMRSH